MPRGWFITFEGGEGTGKSTQVERLRRWLAERGREVVVTREPGGTPLAEAVRAILLDPSHEPDGLSELFLLEAARRDHVRRVIGPALERGAVVLCDRYADSSFVYQGMVRGVGEDVAASLNGLATGGLDPDLTLVFDMDPGLALARARTRNAEQAEAQNRLDDEPEPFHIQVCDGFRRLAELFPDRVRLVDAGGDADGVFERVRVELPGDLA